MSNITYNSTANNGNWNSTYTGSIIVRLWGAGGGAGHYGRTTAPHGGGGGGGGAFAQSTVTVVKNTLYTMNIGGGGTVGGNNANGGTGGNTQFNNNEVKAAGGIGGNRSGAGGAGGTLANSVGTTRRDGGAGATVAATVGGGGGAAAGTGGNGESGSGATQGSGANGGGAGGAGGASNSSGSAGTIPGGGGGGAGENLGTTLKTSGTGANGQVYLQWNDIIAGSTTGGGNNGTFGTIKGKGKLLGAFTGIPSTVTLNVPVTKVYGAGSTGVPSTNNGVLKAKGKLTGSTTGVATDLGATTSIHGHGRLISGSFQGVATNNAILTAKGSLVGYIGFGANILANPTFDSSLDGWGFEGDLIWESDGAGGGRVRGEDATNSMITQSWTLVSGKCYRTIITVGDVSAGSVQWAIGWFGYGTLRSAAGTYMEDIIEEGALHVYPTINMMFPFCDNRDVII